MFKRKEGHQEIPENPCCNSNAVRQHSRLGPFAPEWSWPKPLNQLSGAYSPATYSGDMASSCFAATVTGSSVLANQICSWSRLMDMLISQIWSAAC
jgi:hypothetical protein